MSGQAFSLPEDPVYPASVFLATQISAIQILPREDGRLILGLLSSLPAGAVLRICGEGFDERTAKVFVNGQYYFVFRQEIDWPQASTIRPN
jgi:hypothetical protein